MLLDSNEYAPSMVRFLNRFSRRSERNTEEQNEYMKDLFQSFIAACSSLPDDAFLNKGNGRFNIALYEAVFTATCKNALKDRRMLEGSLDAAEVERLTGDSKFVEAATEGTTATANVKARLQRAIAMLKSL